MATQYETIKGIFAHLDLYGTPALIEALKKEFSHVSLTEKALTIPTEGSRTIKTEKLKATQGLEVNRVIFHRNGRVSIKTNRNQFFQFLNL